MGGRFGRRASNTRLSLDTVLVDAATTPEQKIARVRALYDRPGTAGEKQAAAAALRRLGADPDHPGPSSSYSYTSSSQNIRWEVKIGGIGVAESIYTISGNVSQAAAVARALSEAERAWRMWNQKPAPKFVVLSVRRLS